MFDDFFIRALFVGIGMALVTGPLGCFVVWRRLSFFGDTLAHSALLGITIAYTMEINIALSVFIISSLVALMLLKLEKTTNLPTDALLGLLAHSSLAVGLVVIGLIATIRFDLMGLLFGDILAVNVNDIIIVWFGGALILLVLKLIYKPLFASTVNYELAEAEGMKPERVKAIFTLLLAAIIAISIKMVGLLLITGMLILPAAIARNISSNPKGMVIYSIIAGLMSVLIGLLFGDILAVNVNDIIIVWFGGALILLVLKLIYKPLFASTVNYELAEAEGMKPERVKAIFTLLLAAIIAISIKMVGLLLITGMLILPAAIARNISSNPKSMVIFSVIAGLMSVLIGLFSSLEINTPSGPSIITAGLILFVLSLIKIKRSSQLKS